LKNKKFINSASHSVAGSVMRIIWVKKKTRG